MFENKKAEMIPIVAIVSLVAIVAVVGLIKLSGNGATGAVVGDGNSEENNNKNCPKIAEGLVNMFEGRLNNAQLIEPMQYLTNDGDTIWREVSGAWQSYSIEDDSKTHYKLVILEGQNGESLYAYVETGNRNDPSEPYRRTIVCEYVKYD